MVSKIAVVALVSILAVPILLGYGFNLSEVTNTEYVQDGESVNVTPLLKNDVAYSTTMADAYQINTNFEIETDYPALPLYTTTSAATSFPVFSYKYGAGSYPTENTTTFDTWRYMFYKCNYDGAGSMTFQMLDTYNGNNVVLTKTNFYTLYFDNETSKLYITQLNAAHSQISNSNTYTLNPSGQYAYQFIVSADYSSTSYIERAWVNGESTYADFSQGYYFDKPHDYVKVKLPDKTSSILMTLDLDSITTSNYYFRIKIDYLHLILGKTTTDWSLTDANNSYTIVDNLYVDPTKSSNTYQVYISEEKISTWNNSYTIRYHVEFRYVGDWPTHIGPANSYIVYSYDFDNVESTDDGITRLLLGDSGPWLPRTPLMRMDQAMFAGFAYYIIADQTYDPTQFKYNPTTTINDVQRFGPSIEFGGNTYSVDTSGNITLGTHKVSVNGLKLQSIPTYNGYENKINGNTVSVTASPSTIKFNGSWGASVSTIGNTASTYTTTDWTPGEFAWDGIDDNFLIVGLITSLCAFVGLAIYSRRSKSSLWPLMLVCGGAAMLFLFML